MSKNKLYSDVLEILFLAWITYSGLDKDYLNNQVFIQVRIDSCRNFSNLENSGSKEMGEGYIFLRPVFKSSMVCDLHTCLWKS